MNEVSWNNKWKIRYGPASAKTAASDRRSRHNNCTTPAAARISTTAPSAVESHGCTNVRSSANAAARGFGLSVEHFAGREILAGLRAECGEVCVEPAARDQQRNAPRQAARDEHHAAADQRARHSPADAIDQHEHQKRHREPHGLRSQANAERREKRADHDHASRCRRQRRRQPLIAVGPGVCCHHADIRQACDASAAASPGRSLIGRTPRYQNSGHDAVIAVAASASRSTGARERAGARSTAAPASCSEQAIQADDRHEPAEQRKHRERLALRSSTAARRRPAPVIAVAALPSAM